MAQRDNVLPRLLIGDPKEALSRALKTATSKKSSFLPGRCGQYLTQWRMQVATHELAQSGSKLVAVAQAVGYGSEAAFRRAFSARSG
jgi:AraC-like DNA-binding protein